MNDPTLEPEHADLVARLERAKPIPRPAFRGALGRRLESQAPRRSPARVRRLIAIYAVSGAALFAIAGLSVGGYGPLSDEAAPTADRPAVSAGA